MPQTAEIDAPFAARTDETLAMLASSGQLKRLRTITTPMDAQIRMLDHREADPVLGVTPERDYLCFCSNNYLGLANHPEVKEAAIRAIHDYGAGTASVRFICGTFAPHHHLEEQIALLMGTESSYSFVSCWTASEALFPTFCEAGDLVLSDELNHACIIDAIRLTPVIKKGVLKGVFKHSDMPDLRAKLEAARGNAEVSGQIWVVTDGVFSMEGDIAKLPELRDLCDEFGALLVVDDSHGTGVLGRTGRGVHEHFGMAGEGARQVDFFTGTLGKALGGAAGGFIAGPKRGSELIIQRGRPTLFSNALPVTVACSAAKAIEILLREPERVQRLRDNTACARTKIRDAGFEVLESPTAICPIIVGDTAKAIAMSDALLDRGVFAIGFGYPVVPEGTARIRIQISAAHTEQHIDALVDALKSL